MSGLSANFVTGTSGMSASFPGELVFGMPGEAGGYYSISVSQPDEETMRLCFHPSKSTMHPIDPVDIALPQGPKGDPGQADVQQVHALVEEYLAKNPPKVTESDPTVPQWAKAKDKPSYTAAEVGAVGADELDEVIEAALAQAKESGEFDGITPEFAIGTVETLEPGSDATASISGTKENPVLNLGIPQGLPSEGGNVSKGDLKWKLIAVVDITEGATEFILTKDDSENAFSYQEILIKSPSYPPHSGYLYVRADASQVRSQNVQAWTTAGKSLSMTLALLNGKLGMTSVYRADGSVGTLFENGGGTIDLTEISYLVFGSSAGFTGNGTIYIYGR